MADNTITIEFDDRGGDGARGDQDPGPGRSDAARQLPEANAPPGSPAGKPLEVELTRANADLVASYLSGKTPAEELLRELTRPPAGAPGAEPLDVPDARTPPAGPAPGTPPAAPAAPPSGPVPNVGDELTRFYERAKFGPALPEIPLAPRVAGGTFAAPEGGDPEVQAELFDQFKRAEAQAKKADDKRAAEADRAARQQQQAADAAARLADQQADQTADALGRMLGLGNVSPLLRQLGGLAGGGAGGAGGAAGAAGAAAGAEGGAAGAAGLLGRVAGAVPLGPLLAGVAVNEAADWLIPKAFEPVRRAADNASGALQELARNDLGAMMFRASEGVADFLSNTGLAGKVVAEQVRTLTAVADAAGSAVRALIDRGRELRGFDSNLAAATAAQDVARLQADVREAQVTGESLGRLTEAQTGVEALLREITTSLKSGVVDVLALLLEPVGDAARAVTPLVRTIADGNEAVRSLPRRAVKELVEDSLLSDLIKWARRWIGAADREPERNALLQEVFDVLAGMPVGRPEPRQRARPEQLAGAPTWFGNGG